MVNEVAEEHLGVRSSEVPKFYLQTSVKSNRWVGHHRAGGCQGTRGIWCRFDFVKGYSGAHVRDYVAATSPTFVVGEFWDALDYKGSVPLIKQVH